MKRFLAAIIALVLLAAIPIVSAKAASSAELGEMLIASEKVSGAVGDVVYVDFYLYPNLPDGMMLETIQGSMKFDPEIVKLGAINQVDEENNLTSLMKGRASMFQYNIEEDSLRFAYFDTYGIENEGFWFQAEFRIEKEGSTDFVFNSIQYSDIAVVNGDYQNATRATYIIEPVSVGGIYTEGEEPPENGPVEETYAPLTPAVNTPAPITPTPKPSNDAQPVPITSTLPTVSVNPTNDQSGIVTPPPAVTSIPMVTNNPQVVTAPPTDPENPTGQGDDPVAEATAAPNGDSQGNDNSGAYTVTGEPGDDIQSTDPSGNQQGVTSKDPEQKSNTLIVVGVIIGIFAVLGLGALAIILILKRRQMED